MTSPRQRPAPSVAEQSANIAIAGMFACIAGLGLLVLLPRPAPSVKHDADVAQLFQGPKKTGLRATALGLRMPEEARR